MTWLPLFTDMSINPLRYTRALGRKLYKTCLLFLTIPKSSPSLTTTWFRHLLFSPGHYHLFLVGPHVTSHSVHPIYPLSYSQAGRSQIPWSQLFSLAFIPCPPLTLSSQYPSQTQDVTWDTSGLPLFPRQTALFCTYCRFYFLLQALSSPLGLDQCHLIWEVCVLSAPHVSYMGKLIHFHLLIFSCQPTAEALMKTQ